MKMTSSTDAFEAAGFPWGPVADQPGKISKPRYDLRRDAKEIPERARPLNLKVIARQAWDRIENPWVEPAPLEHVPLAVRVIPTAKPVDPWDPEELARVERQLAAATQREIERNKLVRAAK